MVDAADAHDDEPEGGDGTEELRHRRRAPGLYGKEQDEDDDGDRNHIVAERRRHQLQALDGRQDGQRRRDHRIADEERSTGGAHEEEHGGVATRRLGEQRQQGERAALAMVVGAQQEEHVFQCDDDRQRPDHQRDEADDLLAHETVIGDRTQRLAKGVERAGADVAIDDTDGTKGEEKQRARPAAGMRSASGMCLHGTIRPRASLSSGRRRRERLPTGPWPPASADRRQRCAVPA